MNEINNLIEKINDLIEEKKYYEIKIIIDELNEHDIALILESVPTIPAVKIFRLLKKDIAADIFSYMETDTQSEIIACLTHNEAANIISEMSADDAADLIDEMPANMVNKILSKVDNKTRRDINTLLKYEENSAGSVMTVEYSSFKCDITVKEAMKKIKKEHEEKETIDTSFVIDNKRNLIGIITLKDLVINNEDKKIIDIMNKDVISVYTYDDQEAVANKIKEYDLNIIPVVDKENKLVGIVTIDDVIDIIEEETTEDIEKMAAILPTEKSYLKLSLFELYKSRVPWLLLLMISATFTGKIIEHYESALSSYVILTAFIPMLMNTAGNAGSQTSVTIIRGLSINDLEYKDTLKILFKEFRISILVGITLSICNFLKLIFIDNTPLTISLIVCITLFFVIIFAKIIGSLLPILAKRLGFDPAVMASPFITTIVDALSLLIYFFVATNILNI